MITGTDDLLQKPIPDLPLSQEFKAMAITNGFKDLDAILSFPLTSLLKKSEFSYHIYQEFVEYLRQKEFLHLLKHE